MKTTLSWFACAVLILMGASQSVQAQEPPLSTQESKEEWSEPKPDLSQPRAVEPTTMDYVLMPGAGILGGIGGGLAGVGIGKALCEPQADDDSGFLGPCFGEALAGALVGYPVGMMGSMYLYGELRDLEGSGTGLFLGSLAGFATSGALAWAANQSGNDTLSTIAANTFWFLPPIAGTVGYMLGRPSHPQQRTYGNLLNYDPGAGLQLGAPSLGVATTESETRVTLPLLGGTF